MSFGLFGEISSQAVNSLRIDSTTSPQRMPSLQISAIHSQNGDKTFNYIVFRAGMAGFIVATRFAEDPKHLVAFKDAGRGISSMPEASIPAFCFKNSAQPTEWG
ncbi:hypothetical protein D9758_011689 [Tetrapyrgos nigripes]|uniref:Uncharacterized protein n=1 Tax=Tetrapyrgos nigripes TaxID=182062 RepID=A0A8H5LMQ5_9AGAR|nr:hypothetical protein D9758_011689 [Tetrapyrgos nigripes]